MQWRILGADFTSANVGERKDGQQNQEKKDQKLERRASSNDGSASHAGNVVFVWRVSYAEPWAEETLNVGLRC